MYHCRLELDIWTAHVIGKSGNDINVSISMNGSDMPVTRPETDKAGLSSQDRNAHITNDEYLYMSEKDYSCMPCCWVFFSHVY